MDLPPSHGHLKTAYNFKPFVDAVVRTPPIFLGDCDSCLHLPGKSLQVRMGSLQRRMQEPVRFSARLFDVSRLQPRVGYPQLSGQSPYPMQKEFGSCLRIADFIKKFYGAPVLAMIQFAVRLCNRRISPRNSGDRLWLPDRIRRFHSQYVIAHSRAPFEVQRNHAKPCLTKVKQPGIVAVFLGHLSSMADNL